MALPANTIFRDFVTDGVASSGEHEPVKWQIRELLGQFENVIAAGMLADAVWKATKALLVTDLAPNAGTSGVVYDDSTAANNGIYVKSGGSGSGSWSQVLTFLPGYQFVKASNVGAGSANAIQATSSPKVAYTDGVQLIRLNIYDTNTSGTITVSFDGGAALTIQTASGSSPAIGGLSAGMQVLGMVDQSATVFRLLSDQTSAAIQAASEAAQAAAEAAKADAEAAESQAEAAALSAIAASEASGNVVFYDTKAEATAALGGLSEGQVVDVFVDESLGNTWTRYVVESSALAFKRYQGPRVLSLTSRTAIKNAGALAGDVIYLIEAGRSGKFVLTSGDYSAEVAADTNEGIYFADGTIAATSAAWVRQFDGPALLSWFGLVHEASPSTDQSARLQSMINLFEGKTTVLSGTMTVGIESAIIFKSNSELSFDGLTVYLLDDFSGSINGSALIANNISDTNIRGLKLDGNATGVDGGLYPAVTLGSRGFLIYNGCERVYLEDCFAENVNGNAFLNYGGGDTSDETIDCGFIRCRASACGVGLGQEVHSVLSADPLANVGPQNAIYDRCRAENCSFALYIAGGSFSVLGGYYHSNRNRTLQVYVGDALCPIHGVFVRPYFRHTDTPNILARFKSIAESASVTDAYQKQQAFSITMIEPVFDQETASRCLEVYTGVNAVMIRPKFIGGTTSGYLSEATTPPGGVVYNDGHVHMIGAEWSKWVGDNTYACSLRLPTTLDNPVFRDPAGTGSRCILLRNADKRVVLNEPKFGSRDTTNDARPVFGILIDGTSTNTRIRGAQNISLQNNLYQITGDQAVLIDMSRSNVSSALETTHPVKATTAQLTDITHAINTGAAKVQGYSVYNVDTGLLVYAAGATDGAVWVYGGTGNTAHTPA